MHQLAATYSLRPDRPPPQFHLRNLRYRYPDGTQALTGIDLDILPGDRLALFGQNGAGKTTLARHLNGLLVPDEGQITYKGQPLAGSHLAQARLEIGLLFQDPDDQLFCNSVRENVLFGPCNQGLSPAEAEAATHAALRAVDLAGEADRSPHTLSYGQRKRAALAALLAMQPQVLVLDEPTANLDPHQEQLLLDLLETYPGTLVCITHNLPFAYALCERAVVLQDGRVHHADSLREVVAHQPSQRQHGLDFSFRFAGIPTEAISPPSKKSLAPLSTEPKGPLLQLTDYSYHYPDGRQALSALNLEIERGDRLAIVGENGAGKSTLAACLAGLRSGHGALRVEGHAINHRSHRDLTRRVGLVFQDASDQLFCPSCREEIAFGPRQYGWPKSAIEQTVTEALRRVRLEGFADRVPLHLSGGERKRLALAAVLAMRPDILILDEPTASLDPQGEERLLEILSDLDVTLLLISHDLFFIRQLTERTVVLHQGRIVRDYLTADFFIDANQARINQLGYSYRSCYELKIRELQRQAAGG